MPNQRACLPCKNGLVESYIKKRRGIGASSKTISGELAQNHRMDEFGYTRAPGLAMVEKHLAKHLTAVAVGTPALPTFKGTDSETGERVDVATAIQRKSMELLAAGDMRITAAHALRAQEMIDRRSEKERDRELMITLARVLTQRATPPVGLIASGDDEGGAIIEGEVVVVSKEA